jgi:AraC-like DNA-binding protein
VRVPNFTFKLGVHSAGSELPPHEHDERHQAATTSIAVGAPALKSAPHAGFYDQSPFANMFRRVVGVTPAACRAQAAPSP